MMKQGQATSNTSNPKTEPNSRAVNPGGADQLGQAMGSRMAVTPLFAGHGYEAPITGGQTYKSGSQGEHK
jgi:hypothetical protein